MHKFAFNSIAEKTAVLSAFKQHAPKEFYEAFSRFAQGLQTLPGNSEVVEERMQQLREMMQDFLYEVGLGQNQAVMTWVEKIITGIAPALQQSLQGQQSLSEQLQNVQRDPTRELKDLARQKGTLPGTQEGQTQFDDIGDVYHSRGTTVPPKPTTVPKDLKIQPGKQKTLMRQGPGARASSEGVDKIAMETKYEQLIGSMLELADMADTAGLYEEADKIAAVLPSVRTVKLAQYEGFQNYWIANGRAFEMAYKQKRMKGKSNPDDFRSAQEVWFEVLEEYQKSLLTNQADFIAKYARKDYSIHDRAAQEILLSRITPRVEAGVAPGVAFYEALEELSNGGHGAVVANQLRETLETISEAAVQAGETKIADITNKILKEAGWFDNLSRGLVQKFWDKDYQKPSTQIFERLDSQRNVIGALNSLLQEVQQATAAGQAVAIDRFADLVAPIEGDLGEFYNRMRMTKMPEVRSASLPNGDMVRGGNGDTIDPAKLGQYINLLSNFFRYVNANIAKRMDDIIYKVRAQGLEAPAEAYVNDHSQPNATQTQQPTPQKVDAPAVKSSFENTIKNMLSKLPPDEQYNLVGNLSHMLQQWENDPAIKPLVGTKGWPPAVP